MDFWLFGVGTQNSMYRKNISYELQHFFSETGLTHPNTKKINFWPEIGRDPEISTIFSRIFKISAGKNPKDYFFRKSPKIIFKSFQPSKLVDMASKDNFRPYMVIPHHMVQMWKNRFWWSKRDFCKIVIWHF